MKSSKPKLTVRSIITLPLGSPDHAMDFLVGRCTVQCRWAGLQLTSCTALPGNHKDELKDVEGRQALREPALQVLL